MDIDRRRLLATTATVLTLTAGCVAAPTRTTETALEDAGDDEAVSHLLERNDSHTEELPSGYFDDVLEGQQPPVVSICCSDSRVSQEGMWTVDEPGWLFTPSNIGNVVWDTYEGERVLDGSLHFPVANTGTETVVVVGHSRCGAIAAAYSAVTEGAFPEEPGIRKRVELLVPIVEAGLENGAIDIDQSDDAILAQLVEYNVTQQVTFVLESEAIDQADVYGFVYDFHGTYGDVRGRTYLVSANGVTDTDELQAALPEAYGQHVMSLLESS